MAADDALPNGPSLDKGSKASKLSGRKEVKILMLHGYTQSGPLFRAKTRAVEKLLAKSLAPLSINVTLIYPTGPNRLSTKDIPGFAPVDVPSDAGSDTELDSWAWFRRNEATQEYMLFDEGMLAIAAAIRDAGGIDGVVGFSQGGAMAALLAAALETPERKPKEEQSWLEVVRAANDGRPVKFAVIYSGFITRDPNLSSWLCEPKIRTPTLHYLGSLDTVVEESRSQGLVDRCESPVVIIHPGGHYVPVAKEWVMPLVGFVKKYCEEGTGNVAKDA